MSDHYDDIPTDIWNDFGYANGWEETPKVIKKCRHRKQPKTVGKCVTEYRCEECRYIYKVDSSG